TIWDRASEKSSVHPVYKGGEASAVLSPDCLFLALTILKPIKKPSVPEASIVVGVRFVESVRIFETRTGRELWRVAVPDNQSVAGPVFHPDGRIFIYFCGSRLLACHDGGMQQPTKAIKLEGTAFLGSDSTLGPSNQLAVSPDGRW